MATPGKKRKLRDGTTVYYVPYKNTAGRKTSKACYSAKEAREFHAEQVAERRRGGGRAHDMKFGEFADKLHSFSSISRRERSVLYHESVLRIHLKPWFGDLWLSQITREAVENFLVDLRNRKKPDTDERKYAPGTLESILRRLNVVLNAAVDRRIIDANPAARVAKLYDPVDDAPEPENSFEKSNCFARSDVVRRPIRIATRSI